MPVSRPVLISSNARIQARARRSTFLPWDLFSWTAALRQSGVSGAAMLLILFGGMLQVPEDQASTAHASSTTIWLVRAPLTLAAALLVLWKPVFPKLSYRDLRLWFLVFTGYFCASAAWSTSPVATLGKAFELVIATLIVLHASRDGRSFERLNGIFRLILLLNSSVAFASVLGYLAGFHNFIKQKPGLFTHTSAESPSYSANALGFLAIALLLVLFAEWQFNRVKLVKLIPELVYTLFLFVFSSSRTALAVLCIGVALVLVRRSKVALIAAVIGSCTVAYFFGAKIVAYLRFKEAAGSIETLSGRTVMWVGALRAWAERPILGYGGGVGGKYVISHIGVPVLEKLSHLHNGFLECLTGLGVFGFLLAVSILVVATVRALRRWKTHPQFAVLYVWIVNFWIASMMSMGVLSWMNSNLAIYLLLLANVDLLRKNVAVLSPVRRSYLAPAKLVDGVA